MEARSGPCRAQVIAEGSSTWPTSGEAAHSSCRRPTASACDASHRLAPFRWGASQVTGGLLPSSTASCPRGNAHCKPCQAGKAGHLAAALSATERVPLSLRKRSLGSGLWALGSPGSAAQQEASPGQMTRFPFSKLQSLTGSLGASHSTWGSECPFSSQTRLQCLPTPTVSLHFQKIHISGLVFIQAGWGGEVRD